MHFSFTLCCPQTMSSTINCPGMEWTGKGFSIESSSSAQGTLYIYLLHDHILDAPPSIYFVTLYHRPSNQHIMLILISTIQSTPCPGLTHKWNRLKALVGLFLLCTFCVVALFACLGFYQMPLVRQATQHFIKVGRWN